MKNYLLLLISLFIISSLSSSLAGGGGGSGTHVDPPPGMPSCVGQDAPGNTACTATPICNLNGYCGTTLSSYTVNSWSQLNSAFCGGIHNNSFLSFTAEATTISFDVYVYNCNDNQAIQVFVFKANSCTGGSVQGLGCVDEMYARDTPYNVSANGLIPGEDYYIMIDGFNGHVCDYTFVATSGVSIPVNVNPSTTTICLGETVELTASGGDGVYTWDASSDLNSTTLATVEVTPPLSPGTYSYTVNSDGTNVCSGASSATATVTVESCGCPLSTSNSGPVCAGDVFSLEATIATGSMTSFLWSGPNGYTSSVQNPTDVPAPTTPGSYDYTFTATIDGQPCTSVTTVTVSDCSGPCDVMAIRDAFTNAGCIELDACISECSMYFLNPQSMTGSEAQTFAEGLGANLVSIQTQEENDCILTALNSLNQTGTIWIGLNDEAVEGAFVWYDQSPVTYTNWAPGEPNNSGGNEDCVQIYPTGSNPGMWNDLNCNANDSKSIIEVNLCPVVDAGPNITICEGETATIQSSATILGSAPYTHQWDNNGPSTVANSVSPTVTTDYTLSVLDRYSCTGEDVMTVVVNPMPVVNAGNDITICAGESVILTGTGGAGTWNNGVTNGVAFAPTSTQTYTYTVTTNGCTSSDDVTVTVNARPNVGVIPDDTLGCESLIVNFTNLFQETDVVYTIDFGDGTNSVITDNAIHQYNSAGCYDVTVTADLNGCINTVTYNNLICITEKPIASFTPEPQLMSIVEPHTTFDNSSINANSYTWDFGDGTGLSYANSPSHTYPDDEAGTYVVTLVASSALNCTDTARVVVEVEGELIYYIPNSFTPDGDQYNPTFKPIFTTGYDVFNYNLVIYNRWGETVFESYNADIGWDGTYGADSEKIVEGTYIYKIEFKTTRSDERKTVVGHVTLLR